MNDQLQQAIAYIKSGNKVAGQQFLVQVIKADPRNEAAWLWMTATLDTSEERKECLQRVLQINPNNEMAKKGLAQLESPPKPSETVGYSPREQASQPGQSRLPPGESRPAITATQPQSFSETPSPLREVKALDREALKKCPYCAETIKAEALRCRFCGSDLTGQAKPPLQLTLTASAETLPPGHLPVEQRRQVLDRAVVSEINQGFTLANRTETTANLVKRKKFSGLWFVLLGFIPYVLWYGLVERDKSLFLEVGPKGEILRDGFRVVAKAGTKQKPVSAWRGPIILAGVLVGLLLLCALLALLPTMFLLTGGSLGGSQTSIVSSPIPTARVEHSLKWKVDNRNEDLSRIYTIRGQRIEIMETYDSMIDKLGEPVSKVVVEDPVYPGSWIAEFIYEEYTCLITRSGDLYYVWDIYPNEYASVPTNTSYPTPTNTRVVNPPTDTPVPPLTVPPLTASASSQPSVQSTGGEMIPVGRTITTRDGWELTLIGFDPDAWPEVKDVNSYNDPPKPGNRMVMIRIKATNVGDTEPSGISGIKFYLRGSHSTLYNTYSENSRCGVIPDELLSELPSGGTAEGNVCFQVPTDDTDLRLAYEVGWEDYAYFDFAIP